MTTPPAKTRITSIDFLRGLIMVIMALDHVRDYIHRDNFFYDPLDLDKTSVLLFFTRWITHFCAPIFMFLAGTSAFLVGQRRTKKELSLFLVKRGLWLVFLELVVANVEWSFNITYPSVLFIVLWALGMSMIALAALIHLPLKAILAVALILVAGHNLLDNVHVTGQNLPAFGWAILHEQKMFSWQGKVVLVGYPLLPWIGIMALGYCLGQFYTPKYTVAERKRYLLILGVAALISFVVIRFIDVYGDPSRWSVQSTSMYTFLSFLKVTKYPPSLLYALITLSFALLFLSFTETTSNGVMRVLSVYGRVPMFYYLIHIFLIHLVAMILSQLFTPYGWRKWIFDKPIWFDPSMKGSGFPLWVVYAVWISVVVLLFPLCKRYDLYKRNHKEKWWLSYL